MEYKGVQTPDEPQPAVSDTPVGKYEAVAQDIANTLRGEKRAVKNLKWPTPAVSDTPVATAPAFLSKALGHMQDRAATYDKPKGERSMAQTVVIFNQFHGTTLTEAQGWHLMQILKDVRLFARSGCHMDSAEDCVAYAALKAEAKAKEVQP